MKRMLTSMILPMILALPAFAQNPHEASVLFDANGTLTTNCWPSFTTTNQFWAIGYDLDGQVKGYEFGLTIDPTIIVFSSVMDQDTGPINVGQAPDNWIVGTGACLDGTGAFSMVVFTAGYFVSPVSDLLICMTPSTPSSFSPASPGYLQCDGTLVPMELLDRWYACYPAGCGVLCPTCFVGTEMSSWGSIKSAY